MGAVQEDGVRPPGQLLQGADGRPAQRGRQARRVDLAGPGRADGEGLDPGQQLAGDRGPARRGSAAWSRSARRAGRGSPARTITAQTVTGPAHAPRPTSSTPATQRAPAAARLTLDLVAGRLGRRRGGHRGGRARRGLAPECQLLHDAP